MAMRKRHTPKFKAEVALKAIRELETASELASRYDVHPAMVSQWKKAVLDSLESVFEGKRCKKKPEEDGFSKEQLLTQIGQLKVELDWLKKRLEK